MSQYLGNVVWYKFCLALEGLMFDFSGYLLYLHIYLQLADKHGITPLLVAIWENHLDAVKLLLSKVSMPKYPVSFRSIRVAKRIMLPTSDHKVPGSNPVESRIQLRAL